MSKIGRNDPCPCGSGKKYKKCCIDKERISENKEIFRPSTIIDALIQEGNESNDDTVACMFWDEAWEKIKNEIPVAVTSVLDLEEHVGGNESIYNWCQDFEMKLGNAGLKNPVCFERRIEFCKEFCSLLPDSDELIIENMRRAEAESYFALGRMQEGENAFESLVNDFPNSIWAYIGWGDMYCLHRSNDNIPVDYEKAEKLYREALKINSEETKYALERLEDLEEKKKKG